MRFEKKRWKIPSFEKLNSKKDEMILEDEKVEEVLVA